ncbi:hypothetical protein EYF80_058148 [Liparis tanakae]|uniref:Uncharacterized protein n=1 Tax=Liparis tanakae TaxID=230148 RepID=A0A4Z2ES75_9TELE|nr:hypothetical protein EYF80_058148 [Liparis tanakae]
MAVLHAGCAIRLVNPTGVNPTGKGCGVLRDQPRERVSGFAFCSGEDGGWGGRRGVYKPYESSPINEDSVETSSKLRQDFVITHSVYKPYKPSPINEDSVKTS